MAAYKRGGPEAVVLLRAGPSPRCGALMSHAGWGGGEGVRSGPLKPVSALRLQVSFSSSEETGLHGSVKHLRGWASFPPDCLPACASTPSAAGTEGLSCRGQGAPATQGSGNTG